MNSNITVIRSWCMILVACFSLQTWADQLALPSGDLVAPEVTHEPAPTPIIGGKTHTFVVKVTDNVGVKSVIMFYRILGTENYKRIAMRRGEKDLFSVELGPEDVQAPGVEYYVQAEDLAGNTLLHGYSFSPLIAKVKTPPPGTVADAPSKTATVTETVTSRRVETTPTNTAQSSTTMPKILKNKWLWIGVGVVVGGAALAYAVSPDDATASISAPIP